MWWLAVVAGCGTASWPVADLPAGADGRPISVRGAFQASDLAAYLEEAVPGAVRFEATDGTESVRIACDHAPLGVLPILVAQSLQGAGYDVHAERGVYVVRDGPTRHPGRVTRCLTPGDPHHIGPTAIAVLVRPVEILVVTDDGP